MGSDAQHTTISVYLWKEHAEIFQKAAKDKHRSVPDYFREFLLPVAAKDAGVAVPDLHVQRRGARRALIRSAGELMGWEGSEEEIKQRLAERMAETVLAELAERVKRPSGMRPTGMESGPGVAKSRRAK